MNRTSIILSILALATLHAAAKTEEGDSLGAATYMPQIVVEAPLSRGSSASDLAPIAHTVVDGKAVKTDRFDEWWAKFWETFNGLDENFVDKSSLMLPQAWESFELAQKYYTEDVDVVLPDDMIPYYDSVFALYNEYATSIILGQRPVDDYDEFINLYYTNGGDQLAEYLATVL